MHTAAPRFLARRFVAAGVIMRKASFSSRVSLLAFVFRQRSLAGSWQVLGRFLAGSWQVLGIAFRDQLKQSLSKAKIKLKLKHS